MALQESLIKKLLELEAKDSESNTSVRAAIGAQKSSLQKELLKRYKKEKDSITKAHLKSLLNALESK